jgi:hypothetical protein
MAGLTEQRLTGRDSFWRLQHSCSWKCSNAAMRRWASSITFTTK